MRSITKVLLIKMGMFICCMGVVVPAFADEDDTVGERTRNDNTAQNVGDDRSEARTPMDQSNSEQALAVTSEIRRTIVNDDSLSTYARNIKIITDETGAVTLRGPVRTAYERKKIEDLTKQIAGVARVQSEITVAE